MFRGCLKHSMLDICVDLSHRIVKDFLVGHSVVVSVVVNPNTDDMLLSPLVAPPDHRVLIKWEDKFPLLV